MRIGIDLDDVLVDFISEYVKISNSLWGVPTLNTEPIDWEWSNFNMTKEQHSAIWQKIRDTRNFWMNLGRAKGVSSHNVRALAKIHDLVFITARIPTKGYSVQQQAATWLSLELGLKYPTVIEESEKGPLAAALHLGYFIDDRPKNCIEIMNAVPTCGVYLKDSSHNLSYKVPLEINRVKNFNKFAEFVLRETK